MILEVQLQFSYGRERIYPINELAIKMAKLMGKKTFDKNQIEQLKELGFKVNWVALMPKE
jgi:hypothetical protein